ncbi:MAG: hypothetical protein WC872_05055 [Candidatus Absconditabacterales bacterium]
MNVQTQLTTESTTCLKYANNLAINKNQNKIYGDDLFWGTYNFLRKNDFFPIFANIIGLKNEEALDKFYQSKYGEIMNRINVGVEKNLPLSEKIYTKIQKIVNNGTHKLDFGLLFYITFFDLSTELEGHINHSGMNVINIISNCENIAKNTLINQIGLFAFLEMLSKIFVSFNLDIKNVKNMKIENIKSMNDINMLLDAVDSEIMERNDTTTKEEKVIGKKEEKKINHRIFLNGSNKRSKRLIYRSNNLKG